MKRQEPAPFSEAEKGGQSKGQQEITVLSGRGRGYPDTFWLQDPELSKFKDNAPDYPYEEPYAKSPNGRPEEESKADKEIDQCWAEWVRVYLWRMRSNWVALLSLKKTMRNT